LNMKDRVRPVYFELQGYLSQAPERERGIIYEEQVWNQHNQTVEELEEITKKSYGRYKMIPSQKPLGLGVTTQAYRTTLGGLISRLHAEYFHDDASPIRG
jgi:hypothetical protein